MGKFSWGKFIVALMLPQAAGALGAVFSAAKVPIWYQTLLKPSFTPPGWIFGPVWGLLYIMMGLAFFFVWTADQGQKKTRFAISFFGIHLLINTLWSIVFFGLQSPWLGLITIIVLWLMITGLLVLFWRIRKLAGALMMPYWLWVTFASVLNYKIWQMN
jgi:benzodiazapine receptor